MDWRDRIVTDPDVCGGRPRLKGTRMTVEFLLGLKAAGWSEQQILENYPHIASESRILMSFDWDYGELIFKRGRAAPPSVIYLRLQPTSPEEVVELEGKMVVVTRTGIRERVLPRAKPTLQN